MSWTKRQLIKQAFEAIGLADYVFDLEPEEWVSAAIQMDAMVSSWAGGLGVRIGYPFSFSPATVDLDTDTGIPDYALMAIFLNLGIKLALSLGKMIAPDLRLEAKTAYINLINSNTLLPPSMIFPNTLPRGAGQKTWRDTDSPYFQEVTPSIASGGDSELEFK